MKIREPWLIFCFLLMGCGQQSVFINKRHHELEKTIEGRDSLIQEVFLIGDTGDDTLASLAALQLLKQKIQGVNKEQASIVFLGDNIYHEGLHEKEHPQREEDERRIDAQLKAVENFDGEVLFIPGNHDWQQGGEEGFQFVKRQEKYVQKKLGKKVFRPSNGCSGPDVVELSDRLAIVLIDTQWWLHRYEKGRGEKDNCPYSSESDFLAAFKEVLKKNRNKHIIVAAHHPLYSNGRHGGYYTFKDHLFPLSNINKRWLFPLPVIGSIYPFYRSFFGNIQDIAHPVYQQLKKELLLAMGQYDNLIYVAGHEHNLQYFNKSI